MKLDFLKPSTSTPNQASLMEEERRQLIKKLDHPFYFYQLDAFKERLRRLQESRPEGLELWYATKANPLSSVIKAAAQENFRFDVASPGELQQVLRQGVSPSQVLVTGPAKSKNLLERYLNYGVRIFVLESLNQLKWLHELSLEYRIRPQVLLRLQIQWEEDEVSVLGGSEITPFGLEAQEWKQIKIQDYPWLQFIGIHTFQWGNILSTERLLTIWDRAFFHCQKLAQELKLPLEVVDVGGGLGIPYGDEANLDWNVLMQGLSKLKEQYQLPKVWMELGRYVIGPYGSYQTKIVDKKHVRGREMLVLDSGINQMARPTLTKQSFPCRPLYREGLSETKREMQIHGPLCTALDHLGGHQLPQNLKLGDWLVFEQAGAYGFTESMPFFLCHSLPGEAIFQHGKSTIIRNPLPAKSYLL